MTDIEDFLADRAADLGVTAGRDTFSVSAKFPHRFGDEFLGLLREILTAPSFAPQEAERARQEQVAAINRREDRPMGLAFRKAFPFLFTGPVTDTCIWAKWTKSPTSPPSRPVPSGTDKRPSPLC